MLACSFHRSYHCNFIPQLIKKTVIWHNPIRMQYQKKNHCFVSGSKPVHRRAISELQQTQITTANKAIYIKHEMILTVIDGEICNLVWWAPATVLLVTDKHVICEGLLYLQCSTKRN